MRVNIFFLIVTILITSSACSHEKIISEEQMNSGEFTCGTFDLPFTGEAKVLYAESNTVKYLFTYKKGVLHGPTYGYYPNGDIKHKGYYSKGHFHGQWTEYYQNNEVKSEVFYENNALNGSYALYFRNGVIREKGYYTLNKKSGTWQYFNKEGEMITTVDAGSLN